MDFETLESLRKGHPAWRLLTAAHAPFVASFLHRAFIAPNARTMAGPDLVARLDDYLYELRERLGDEAFPKAASQYLDDWASDSHGWLRKYYKSGADEPYFDLMPATEKALEWLASLERRQFVSTESRLLTVFELLRQIVQGVEVDPQVRIAELERRRAEIDAEIDAVRNGRVSILDSTQVKDRFLQLTSTARALLSDFREVEQNFRDLDRQVRERVATWEGGKGALLEEVFGERDAISDSDQGRTFRAFWDFLMSPVRQEELTSMLQRVFELEPVRALKPDARLRRIHYDWLEAGDVTQRTVARLSDQLRRYLDDRTFLENKRLMQLTRSIEQHALAMREAPPSDVVMALSDADAGVELPMDRPLYSPPLRPKLVDQVVVEGQDDHDAAALFEQVYVDKQRLLQSIRRALQSRSQISLAELVSVAPLEQGLAEVVTYLTLASEDAKAVIDEERSQQLVWAESAERTRRATVPLVIFCQ